MTRPAMALPPKWSWTRLDRVATVNARIGWKALTAAEYQPQGYAFLSTPNIKSRDIDYERVNFINKFRYDESPELKLQPGDVLLAKDGNTLGIVNIVRDLPREATVNGSIAVLRPHSMDPNFLRYAIASTPTQSEITAVKGGMGVPHLFQWDIKRFRLPAPPIDEQRRIADFLDAETSHIDSLSNLSYRQKSALTELFQEQIRQSTTVEQGKPAPTGIPWMPEINVNWQLVKVSHAFFSGSGTTPDTGTEAYFGGPFPWVNSGDINDGTIFETSKSITSKAVADYSALKMHRKGSLIIGMYGQGGTKGKTAILGIDAYLNQACCALAPTGGISTQYAAYWFRAHKSGIVALALGAGQPNLSQEVIRQLRIPTPGINEQRRIVSALSSAEARNHHQQELLDRRIRLLSERRQALITAAVTGQFDVSTASGRNTTQGV